MGRVLGAFLLPHPPILIGEIGGGEEDKAKSTLDGYILAVNHLAKLKPEAIIVITPHGPLFTDANSIYMEENLKGDFSKFGYPQLSYRYRNSIDLTYQIVKNSLRDGIPIAQMTKEMFESYNLESKLDHGVLLPLHFVDKFYHNFEIVPITYGLLSSKELYDFGNLINKSILQQKKDVVIIASGDLSHKLSNKGPYSYSKEGEEFDSLIVELIEGNRLEEILTIDLDFANKAGECGLRSLMILTGILSNYEVESKMISYEGPFGVGYGIASFDILNEEKKDYTDLIQDSISKRVRDLRSSESDYVKLARMSLEHYLKSGTYMDLPEDISEEILNKKQPVFVSIKKNGRLRGCIGSLKSFEKNTAMEIIKYAVEAGIRDFRFTPVSLDEVDELTFSVDVLHESEPVEDMAGLDPINFGVIVKKGNRKGLLLPNIEGVDTVDEQLRIALNKAGIDDDEDYEIERFRVERYH